MTFFTPSSCIAGGGSFLGIVSVAIALVSSFFVSTTTFSLGGTSALVVSFLIVDVVMSSFTELSLESSVVTMWSPVVFVALSSDSEDFLLFSRGFTFHALDVPCEVFEVGRFHPLDFFVMWRQY